MPDEPMPRRVRPQDRADAASSEERGKPRLTDELMSQFDAIERVLRARREADEDVEEQELPTAPERQDRHERPERQERQERSERRERPVAEHVGAARGSGASKGSVGRAAVRTPPAAPERPAPPPAEPRRVERRRIEADDEEPGAERGRSRTVLLLVAAGAAAAAFAVVAAILALMPSASPSNGAAGTQQTPAVVVRPSPTPYEVAAAQWVADNVGPDHVVACDVNLCALVRQFGSSAASLVTAGSDLASVERADVVISTSLMRTDFGAQLTAISSAEPLASFGTGGDQVVVSAVAIDGTADYSSRLASDRNDRRRIGAVMSHSPRITYLLPQDATELSDGLVDTRLSSLLTLISSTHALTVSSFSGTGPGAGADVPESDAVISRFDGQPVGGSTPQAAALITLVNAQLAPYRPLSVVSETDGVKISFSQPEPLGLVAANTP